MRGPPVFAKSTIVRPNGQSVIKPLVPVAIRGGTSVGRKRSVKRRGKPKVRRRSRSKYTSRWSRSKYGSRKRKRYVPKWF